MTDSAVIEYRKRREERLAARGLRPKQFRKTGEQRRAAAVAARPTSRAAGPNEGEEEQNNGGRRGGRGSGGGGHGNTRLPFGLCMKYGIDIGPDWGPRECWEALGEKGITAAEAYRKFKAGEEIVPTVTAEPPKEPARKIRLPGYGNAEYEDLAGEKRSWVRRGDDPWILSGTRVEGTADAGYTGYCPRRLQLRFRTKTDMLHLLKEMGVEEFTDPETGELLNPKTMDLPKMLFKENKGSLSGFMEASIGMKKGLYAVIGTDFDGKKHTLKEYHSLDRAQIWLEDRGVSEEDIKLSPALKKREKERVGWLTSDKKEYMDLHGTRYGDLTITQGRYGGEWIVTGQDEEGRFESVSYRSRTELMKFLKEQGVEKVREAKAVLNPQDFEIPPTVARIEDTDMQKLEWRKDYYGALVLYGYDLDGNKKYIMAENRGETVAAFKERVEKLYGVTDSMVEADDSIKAWMTERAEKEVEKDRRRREFEKKAIELGSSRYADVEIRPAARGYEMIGYDQYGDERSLCVYPEMSRMSAVIERYGLDPDQIIKDKAVREAYDKLQAFKKDFDAKKVVVRGSEYADLEVVREGTEYKLIGHDREGTPRSLTFSGGFEYVTERAELMGLDIKDYLKDEEIRKEYAAFEERKRDFEARAIEIAGYKYADVTLEKTPAGRYRLTGYTLSGEKSGITYSKDLYDTLKDAEGMGVDTEKLIKSEEVAADCERLKRTEAEFEEKAINFGSSRYMDLELDYSDSHKLYTLYGTNKKGVRTILAEMNTAFEMEQTIRLWGGDGFTMDAVSRTKAMQERDDFLKRSREAVATGEYFDLGVDGEAFKGVRAEKSGSKWRIYGTGLDGSEKEIKSVSSWDDAVETLESHGVKAYRMTDGDKTMSRPNYGMHRVLLAKKPEGGYAVYADSKRFGSHAVMYEGAKEEECRAWMQENNIDESSVKTRGMNPNDDVVRTHTAKSLANFDSHRMSAIEGSIIDDMTKSEKTQAAEMLTELFTNGAYRCERSIDSFGGIIENGYLSQLETGTAGSGASTSKSSRKECSKTMYGHSGLDPHDYEKFGYLGAADEAEEYDISHTPGYGGSNPCVYTFRKDRMKDRVSYTMGDSLNCWSYGYLRSAGYAGEKPTLEGLTALGNVGRVRDMLRIWQTCKSSGTSHVEMLRQVRRAAGASYIELQYNGDVTVADIEKISFKRRADLDKAFERLSNKRRKNVIRRLQENKVQLLCRNGAGGPFVDAWDYLRSRYPDDFES